MLFLHIEDLSSFKIYSGMKSIDEKSMVGQKYEQYLYQHFFTEII